MPQSRVFGHQGYEIEEKRVLGTVLLPDWVVYSHVLWAESGYVQLRGLPGLLDALRWDLDWFNPQVSRSPLVQCNSTITKQYLESRGEVYEDLCWRASSDSSLGLPERVSSAVL